MDAETFFHTQTDIREAITYCKINKIHAEYSMAMPLSIFCTLLLCIILLHYSRRLWKTMSLLKTNGSSEKLIIMNDLPAAEKFLKAKVYIT